MKSTRSKNKGIKPKYEQTEFPYVEHMKNKQRVEPKYAPPKPSEMTNVELEKWLIASPSEKLKSEILKRMHEGVIFSRFEERCYLGGKPSLVPVFKPEEDEKK
jgi:hypothetical protein